MYVSVVFELFMINSRHKNHLINV